MPHKEQNERFISFQYDEHIPPPAPTTDNTRAVISPNILKVNTRIFRIST